MIKTFRRAWQEIGGKELANPRKYWPVIPISLIGGVQIGQNTLEPEVAIGYFFANGLGLALCLLIGYLIWLARLRNERFVHPSLVVGFALAIGATKGISTGLLVFLFGLEASVFEATVGRLPGATIAGLFTVLLVSFHSSLQNLFKDDRKKLIATRVSRDQASFVTEKIIDLERLIAAIKINMTSSSAPEAAKLLRELLELRIKPLSKELWVREEKRLRSFEGRDLLERALFAQPYPTLALTLLILVISPNALQILTRLDAGSLSLLIQLALLMACYITLNALKRIHSRITLLVVSFASVVASSYVFTFVIPELIVGSVPDNAFYTFLFLLVYIPNIGLMAASILYFLKIGSEQIEEIQAEERGLATASVDELDEMFIGRELAGALHGRVQNQILHSLGKIEAGSSFRDELESVSVSISQLKSSISRAGTITLKDVANSWSAFLDIQADADRQLSRTQARVIEEAISNSYRHGKATRVKVELSSDGKQISITDDGYGPVQGKQGLGSLIFSSAGKWRLTANIEGGAVFSIELWG